MFDIASITIAISGINLHFALYGAFGAHLLLRAVLAARGKHFDEAREHSLHGTVYFMLGMS